MAQEPPGTSQDRRPAVCAPCAISPTKSVAARHGGSGAAAAGEPSPCCCWPATRADVFVCARFSFRARTGGRAEVARAAAQQPSSKRAAPTGPAHGASRSAAPAPCAVHAQPAGLVDGGGAPAIELPGHPQRVNRWRSRPPAAPPSPWPAAVDGVVLAHGGSLIWPGLRRLLGSIGGIIGHRCCGVQTSGLMVRDGG